MITKAEDIDDRGAERLAAAIVIRAINDYKELSSGKTNTPHCNTFELNKFLETGCDTYLTGHTGKELHLMLLEKYGTLPEYKPPKVDTYKPKSSRTQRWIKQRMGKTVV